MNWWQTGTKVEGSYSLEERKRPINKKGLIIIGITNFIIACFLSTEFIASRFNYVYTLGKPLFIDDDLPIYNPFNLFHWLKILLPYININHNAFMAVWGSAAIFLVLLGLPIVFVFSNRIAAKNRYKQRTLYGSAHWAEEDEIKDAGLLPIPGKKGKGVYVGGWTNPKTKQHIYLRHSGPEHVLCFAPTRSGKGIGLVIPTLLAYEQSCLIFDIKGENYAYTAGYRKKVLGHYVLKFDPIDTTGTTARYNPLGEIRIGTPQEQGDVENLCIILADPDGKGTVGGDKFWIETAESLLSGVVMHLLYKCKNEGTEPTLGEVYRILTNPEMKIEKTLTAMLTYPHDPEYKMGWVDSNGQKTITHPYVAAKARDFLDKPEKEAGSVLSTAKNAMKIFFDPVVNSNLSNSTFCLNDLMNADKPVSLYLCISPANLSRFSSLLRVLLTQIVTILANDMDWNSEGIYSGSYKHQLLLMLDEFPSLGAMEKFESQLAYIAGFGLRAYLITQDITQLEKAYTKSESIMSNCHIKIAYAANKIETATVISEMLGDTTIIKEVTSSSSSKNGTSVSHSIQEQGRKLLTKDEVMRLPGPIKENGKIVKPGAMLIIPSGRAPIYGTQIVYFQDKVFSKRAKIRPAAESDTISLSPFKHNKIEETERSCVDKYGNQIIIEEKDETATAEELKMTAGEAISEETIMQIEAAGDPAEAFDLFLSQAVQEQTLQIGDMPIHGTNTDIIQQQLNKAYKPAIDDRENGEDADESFDTSEN